MDDKKRFAFSPDGLRIRASQGHSVEVDLGLPPVVLGVRSGEMHRDGHAFYQSDNGVWLTEAVPPRYLEIPG